MYHCKKCGKEIYNNETVCPECGAVNTPYEERYERYERGEKIRTSKIVALISAAAAIVSLFLPWGKISLYGYDLASYNFETIYNGEDGKAGTILMIITITAIIVFYIIPIIKDRPKRAIAPIWMILMVIMFWLIASDSNTYILSFSGSIGFILFLTATIACVITKLMEKSAVY